MVYEVFSDQSSQDPLPQYFYLVSSSLNLLVDCRSIKWIKGKFVNLSRYNNGDDMKIHSIYETI